MSEPENALVPDNSEADKLNMPVSIVAQTLIRGVVAAVAPDTPVHLTMRAIAFHVGFGISGMIKADTNTLINVRKSVMEAFNEGVRKAPLNSVLTPDEPAKPNGQ